VSTFVIGQIRQVHCTFSKLGFVHALRENNQDADHYANLAKLKNKGTLALNNMDNYQPILFVVAFIHVDECSYVRHSPSYKLVRCESLQLCESFSQLTNLRESP
jgi:hypothetical protein